MSLCIAALAFDNAPVPSTRYSTSSAIVSWDTRITAGNLEEDGGHKFAVLSPRWCCLVAGKQAQGFAIARSVAREFLRDELALDELTIPERIRAGAKKCLTRRLVADVFNVNYDDIFVPESLAPDDVRERILEYMNANASAIQFPKQELIFVGWVKSQFVIYRYEDGDVCPLENYATIGSGGYHASVMLNMRKHEAFTPVDDAVYSVYEAQRVGAMANGVGYDARVDILRYDRELQRVAAFSVNGREGGFLDKTFLSLLPRPYPENFRLEPGVVEQPWMATPFRGKRGDGYFVEGVEIDDDAKGAPEHGKTDEEA